MVSVIHPVSSNAGNAESKRLQVDHLFQTTDGTIVIKNLRTDKTYTYNPERSETRYTPESSFKIPNALIGLEEQAVADEYEVKRWDGVVRAFETWNRDHSLASAMRQSAIWFYQDLARYIGPVAMQRHVDEMQYGNRDISGGIDTFWLNSSLKISAREQVDFIEDLVEETLPVQKQHMKTVKRMMIAEEQDEYTVHGKTGTRLSDMGLGWFVGYVETDKDTWVFATNVDSSGTVARNITMDCLEDLFLSTNAQEIAGNL
ncbi:beta-lactamase [Paenibacillus swuensis]|uniref:Beta-lactamase n=1 Tax=Paenibacillus swuensis TaxID=1178515 RepID=A0A172TPK2_9BACL|nr:beta-lactamase [Paenibacillus swuensis]